MARKRKSEELFEENVNLEEEFENYDYDENPELSEEEEEESGASVGRKLLTVLIILIALIALFFLSVNLTTLWLQSNEEPDSYETEAPYVEEDEEIDEEYNIDFGDEEEDVTPEETKVPAEVLGEDKPSVSKPAKTPSAKPSAQASVSPSAEPTKAPTAQPTKAPSAEPTKAPAPTSAPETQAPTQPPAKTNTPVIKPGNPAA